MQKKSTIIRLQELERTQGITSIEYKNMVASQLLPWELPTGKRSIGHTATTCIDEPRWGDKPTMATVDMSSAFTCELERLINDCDFRCCQSPKWPSQEI